MTPDLPPNPRAELEARVTAWLLGELSADEAATVRAQIEKDPELARLRDRLSQTLNLLRETIATPIGETPALPRPLKLSAARREKLLAQFKTIRPKEFEAPKRWKMSFLEVIGVAACIMVLAALLLPSLSRSKSLSTRSAILSNLRQLDFAKHMWAEDQHQSASAKPTMEDLKPYMGHGIDGKLPAVAGETYTLGPVGQPPVAQYNDKTITLNGVVPAGSAPVAHFGGNNEYTAPPDSGSAPIRQAYVDGNAAEASSADTLLALRQRRLTENTPAPTTPAGQIVLPQSDEWQTGTGNSVKGVEELREKATLGLEEDKKVQRNYDASFAFQSANKETQLETPPVVMPAPAQAGVAGTEALADALALNGTVKSDGAVLSAKNISNSGELAVMPAPAFRGEPKDLVALDKREAQAPINRWGGAGGGGLGAIAKPAADMPAPPPASVPEGAFPSVPTEAMKAPMPSHGGQRMVQKEFEPASRRASTLTIIAGKQAPEAAAASATPPPAVNLSEPPATGLLGSTAAPSPPSQVTAADTFAYSDLALPNGAPSTPKTSALSTRQLDGGVEYSGIAVASPDATAVKQAQLTSQNRAESADKERVEKSNLLPPSEAPADQADRALPRPVLPAPIPQPEVLTSVNAFTTFSLNISDVAFKLAEASLQNGQMPDAASMRSEEFINAFDYRDPDPAPGAPIGFAWERAGDPFAHNRDFLRFSIKTAAQGRQAGRPLNLVLLLDKSGSMERADRVEIIARALNVLASQLQPNDTLSVVVFARTARLFVDGVPGSQGGSIAKALRDLTPEGGTNLEEAMRLAYEAALRHYLASGENRVVLLTDGAANLGNVDPGALKRSVESNHKQGIAFDCFGVGWDGYNDNLLETLSRAGNGRYGFINTPEEAATEFAGKLAGALRVAAADVKVQVEFNPARVTAYRQIGYAKDQLKKEDFRNNSVKAAQIGAAESGNALYTVQINPAGEGPLGTVHVRYRVPGTEDYQEHEWIVPYTGGAVALDQASPAMRLAATAAAFSEWLAGSPFAGDVTPDRLLNTLRGVPQVYGADTRPTKLEWMIRQAKSISGK